MAKILLEKVADIDGDMHAAVADNDCCVVRRLLEEGANVNSMNQNGLTPLAVAVKKDYCYMAKLLLKNGADIAAAGIQPDSLLYWGVERDDTDIVELAMQRGGSVNSVNQNGLSPLAVAVKKDYCYMFKLLLKNGADIVAAGIHPNSLLYWGVERDDTDIVELVMQRGGSVNSVNQNGLCPLAVALKRNVYMAIYLLKNGADISAAGLDPDSLLYWGVERNNTTIVKQAMQRGGSVNSVNQNGLSPLAVAVKKDYHDMAEFLLENGADIAAAGLHADSLLHWGVEKENCHIVKLAMQSGGNVNCVNQHGLTPLAVAVEGQKWRICNYTLLHNSDHVVGDCDLVFFAAANSVNMYTFPTSFVNIFKFLMKYNVLLFCETKLSELDLHVSFGDFWIECSNEKKKLEIYLLFSCHKVALELVRKTTENEMFDFFYCIVPYFDCCISIHEVPFLQNPGQYVSTFENTFSIYLNMLCKKFSLGVIRYYWINLTIMILQHSSSPELPFHVWIKICKGVNNSDMKNLVLYYREQLEKKIVSNIKSA